MRLLAWSGQRGAALVQYEACRRAMAQELGVEPAAETEWLYEQIRSDGLRMRHSTPVHLPDFDLPFPPSLEEGEPAEKSVFVARERELARLARFLDGMLAGQGQIVFVIGEAGQGKTALIQEFVRRAQAVHPDLIVSGGNGNAHSGLGDPYLPFRQVLGLLVGDIEAQWTAGAVNREQARRLWHLLPLAVEALIETAPDLVDTLIPGAVLMERVAAMDMMLPGQVSQLPRLKNLLKRRAASSAMLGSQQSNLCEQYAQMLRVLALERPLLLVLDDLQWADPASVSLLFHLGRHIESSRILIVGAYRPAEVNVGRNGERHLLAPVVGEFKRRLGKIEVDLEQAQGRRFVEAFLHTLPSRLSPAFYEMLYRQTGGHPLFTVELLRSMQERGDLVRDREGFWIEGSCLSWEMLPARVEAVIAERIGQLPQPLQQTLRVASVEGETFTAEVVARVQAAGEQETRERLSRELSRKHHMVRAQGLQRLENKSLARYQFRHILFQKYLYNSLDAVERARLHEAFGTALEELHGEQAEGSAAIAPNLAWHFKEAGLVRKAVEYLRQAGEQAVRMSANEEAIALLTQGLALLETLPYTQERDRAELALQVRLSAPLQAVKGYQDPGLDHLYARARELCEEIGDVPQLLAVLGALVIVYGNRGEHCKAREIAEQHVAMAERLEDPISLAPAYYGLGWSLLFLGEFLQARSHLEQVCAAYDPRQHSSQPFLYGYVPGVAARASLSWILWLLGYPEQALKRAQETLGLAKELSHPFSQALAKGLACICHLLQRDVHLALELGGACTSFATEQGFRYWWAMGALCRGWALVQQGRAEEGFAQIHQSRIDVQATASGGAEEFQLGVVADAYRKMGQAKKGLDLVNEALAIVRRTGACWYEAELHRLQGELLSMQGYKRKAEASFHQAIEVARRQSARSWELRATMSLSCLWHKQGKREEARPRLAEIYGWFTEGFDTPDLVEARALLAALT
jgi:predicted ATPase